VSADDTDSGHRAERPVLGGACRHGVSRRPLGRAGRADVQTGVLRPYVADGGKTVPVEVADGVVTLTGRVDRWSTADITDRLTRQIAGVVDVVDKLDYEYDDRDIFGAGIAYGVA
jgi:hypothetical protein